MSVFYLAFAFFLVTNPIGNAPAILAILHNFDIAHQRKILFREAVLAVILAVIFLFVGEKFLELLSIRDYTVSFCGGILLFLVAIGLIYPHHTPDSMEAATKEPIMVPIATPLLAGGALLTAIMLYAHQEANNLKVLVALLMSGIAVTAVLVVAPWLNKLLGRRGLYALEQLMGMLLCMLSTEMMVRGARLFFQSVTSG